MLKRAFQLMVLGAGATWAALLLPNAPNFAVVLGQTPPQERAALRPADASAETRKTIPIERAPLRVIKDSKSSFSAVALDVARD